MPFRPIFAALDAGATVVVPTNRLQREILWNYLQSKPQAVILTPKCFAYENWLTHWFEAHQLSLDCSHQQRLLSDAQFQWLTWSLCSPKLNFSEVTRLLNCYKNLKLAQALPEGSDFLYHPQASQFQAYWQTIEQRLRDDHCLVRAELATWLAQQPYCEAPHPIWFACFDTLHPQQQTLIQSLEDQGQLIHYYDLKPSAPPQVLQFVAADEVQEEQAIVAWVRDQCAAGKTRIGVVVPDLHRRKHQLLRQLQAQMPSTGLHCSLGTSLLEFPLIQQSLTLLFLDPSTNVSKTELKVLLHTPWLHGADDEAAQRAQLSNYHRMLQEPALPWSALLSLTAKNCPKLHQTLAAFNPYPAQASIEAWIVLLEQRLNLLDFTKANSELLAKLFLSIENLHELQGFVDHLELASLQAWLRLKFQQDIHQPPQDHAGVHLMGWLESSGFCGDAVWICQFLAQNIPQPPNFSSWLPITWQKQQQLPRTSYEQEQVIAASLVKRLQAANPCLVFSYPATIEQQAQWPSPMFPHHADHYRLTWTEANTLNLEFYADPQSLPFLPDEAPKGGSQLLSAYANCPFQAFAKYRLHATSGSDTHLGLDAREHGQLIHQALFYLWQALDTQQSLKSSTAQQLAELVEQAITQALAPFKEAKPYSLDPFMLTIEASKARKILQQVITFDQNRPPFTIAGLEQELSLSIESLEFKLRYDRLDRLENGDLLLIDYKSSLPTPLPWRSNEPLHPQILMYALAQAQIKGLMFAALTPHDYQSAGISAQELAINGIKPSKAPWEDLQHQWLHHLREQIIKLKAGDFQPNPAQNSTCKRCHYQELCRFQSSGHE